MLQELGPPSAITNSRISLSRIQVFKKIGMCWQSDLRRLLLFLFDELLRLLQKYGSKQNSHPEKKNRFKHTTLPAEVIEQLQAAFQAWCFFADP